MIDYIYTYICIYLYMYIVIVTLQPIASTSFILTAPSFSTCAFIEHHRFFDFPLCTFLNARPSASGMGHL